MARTPILLTPEELATIATAPSGLSTADLARQLGCYYFTVAKARQRIQQAGGWYTPLTWTICAACGQPLCHGPRRRIVHVGCRSKRIAHLAKEHRKRDGHATSTRYVKAWRKRNPDKSLKLRDQEKARVAEVRRTWTPEQWAPVLERAHTEDRHDQAVTAELASRSGDTWTRDDDQFVLDNLHLPARDVALELGRSLWAVRNRRVYLRRKLGLGEESHFWAARQVKKHEND